MLKTKKIGLYFALAGILIFLVAFNYRNVSAFISGSQGLSANANKAFNNEDYSVRAWLAVVGIFIFGTGLFIARWVRPKKQSGSLTLDFSKPKTSVHQKTFK